jgi:hypothetical protein
LRQGEPYLITDENRIAVGLSTTTYEVYAKALEGITVSSTAPGSPAAGGLWFSSVDGSLSVYYDDGTSSQWVAVSGPQGTTGPAGAPGADGADGADGTTGIGVPAGGTAGQVLTKTSATDYATTWADQQITVSATAPASPTLNQLWLDIS